MQVTYGKGFAIGPKPTVREKVEKLEESMLHLPQVECPVRHYFAPGVYAREITIPKGTVLTGAIHKRENLVVLSAGRLRLMQEDGHIEISAPHTMLCKAGAKNAAYALEDAVWTNFFATEETDPDKLVELLTHSKADELLGGANNKQLVANGAAITGAKPCHLEQ